MCMTINHKYIELTITHIGKMGDGVGEHDGKAVFVPLTCAGDVVRVEVRKVDGNNIRASLIEVITPSDSRQEPECKHFGTCGGCSLQHLSPQNYGEFKQNILNQVVTELGADESIIAPMISVGKHSRRRAEFKISLNKGNISIGFLGAKTHDIIPLDECHVCDQRIMQILPAAKACFESFKKAGVLSAISITALDNGLDIVITSKSAMRAGDREKLIAFAKDNGVIRLSEQVQQSPPSKVETSRCLYDNDNAFIKFADVEVELPVGAFLQASETAQTTITELVTKHLENCNKVADLYSGCGTYSFALAKQSQHVVAFEGDYSMTSAMHNAIFQSKLEDKISVNTLDLFTTPLTPNELSNFDGVVINPPRNGAMPQIKNIAKSNVQKTVMVSCNPATFKRDAKHLIENGFELTMAVAIDQFYWSNHLEVVGVFGIK